MIDTKTLNQFNAIRALIVCQSPQVNKYKNYIAFFERQDDIMVPVELVARLAYPDAWSDIVTLVNRNPDHLQLHEMKRHEKPSVFVIRLTYTTTDTGHLAYMLT